MDRRRDNRPIFLVQFDVAVTAAEGENHKAGIGVVGGFLGLGASTQANEALSAVSRIQFQIPLSLPHDGEE